MRYKKLEIWSLACELIIDVHRMTLKELPKFEMYEEGSQIRRSIKSVKSNIVEACLPDRQGYGRRKYIRDYIKFLVYAQASNDETIDHLETLFVTSSLTNIGLYENLHERLDILGKKLNLFIQSIERSIQR